MGVTVMFLSDLFEPLVECDICHSGVCDSIQMAPKSVPKLWTTCSW